MTERQRRNEARRRSYVASKILPPSDKLAIIELKLRELEAQIKTLFVVLSETKRAIIESNGNSNFTTRQEVKKIIREILTERLEPQTPAISSIVEWFDRQGYSFVKRLDNKEKM